MSQYADDPEANESFDVNDPELGSFVPEINPEAVPQMSTAPPSDGPNWVIVRPRPDAKNGPCYTKGEKDRSGKLVRAYLVGHLTVRIWDEDRQKETGFLDDWYPTTLVMQGQSGSQLSAICFLAGQPARYGATLEQIQEQFLRIFEEAGDDGVKLLVRTRWKVRVPKVDEDGMPVFLEGKYDRNGNAIKATNDFLGEKKIKKMAALQAKSEVLQWERYEDETPEEFETRKQDWIDSSDERAHLFTDPVSGEQIAARAEVAELLDHTKLPKNQK